ncbi:unnamed protein product, partial [marine sediment metagenome]
MSIEKTKEMEKYEKDTGKKAIWRKALTEGFKRWQLGEETSKKHLERITILTSTEIKEKWQEYASDNNFSTFSKLIRKAVSTYIETEPKISYLNDVSNLTYGLKVPLTSIKGFSHLIIENFFDQLNPNIALKIKEIYSQSQLLEKKIDEILSVLNSEKDAELYDILIVDNDNATLMVLKEFFEYNGYACKCITTGKQCLEEVKRTTPKLILSSILLPDISGYEVCKEIKTNDAYRNIPFYYITVIPKSEVINKVEETRANGYYLKPFNFSLLNELV